MKNEDNITQWLTVNHELYEFVLLHAILHDPSLRSDLMAIPLKTTDFSKEENSLILGAMIHAQDLMNELGSSIPTSPSTEWLRPYVESAAFDMDMDESDVGEAMQQIEALQDPSRTAHYYFIPHFFDAWLCAMRARRTARLFTTHVIPESREILENLQTELAAAREFGAPLDSCKFDFDNCPPPPEPVLSLGAHTICTPGNISNIQGPPKAAKSAVVAAILAASMREPGSSADTLGFVADNFWERAVVHIDTEQSAHDHDSLVRLAYRRAKQGTRVDWLHSYSLTGMEPERCWEVLIREVEKAAKRHNGVKMIIIDGIADFCSDPNDPKDCFNLVRKLHKLALDHECVILSVIHENPGSAAGKTRGHLGSQLDRKAETSLRLMKDEKTGTVTMWAERARHCFMSKNDGLQFHWCNDARMHVTIREDDEAFVHAKLDKQTKYQGEVANAFGQEDAELSFSQFVVRLVNTAKIAESTAKARIKEFSAANLVEKTPDGKYRIQKPLRAA